MIRPVEVFANSDSDAGENTDSTHADADRLQPAKSDCSSVCGSDAALDNRISSPSARGHYKSYGIKEKEKVVLYARAHGIRNTATTFKIPKSTLSNWMKIDFDEQRNDKGHLTKAGRPLTYSQEIEDKLVSFVLEQRDLQLCVSIEDLCNYAKELVGDNNEIFKGSRTWANKFMERHDLVLRSKTSMTQRLSADLEPKIASFHEFITRQREKDEFDDRCILNMDETPVYFDIVPSKTIDVKGRKSIRVRTTASDKRHLTVVLAVSAAGDMLPPMVIFKGKRELNIPHPPGWIVCVQQKGWMDESLMIRWINEVLVPHTQKDRSLLILDSFAGHKTEAVKKTLRKVNAVPAMIPGGCTSKLQPLDVSINKPFKAELRKSWSGYMREQTCKLVGIGEKVKAASKEDIIQWLKAAVEYIAAKDSLIVRSFKACGISNVLSGAEDCMIRQDIRSDVAESEDETEIDGYEDDDVPLSVLIAREIEGDTL